jgi:hypothetical protein
VLASRAIGDAEFDSWHGVDVEVPQRSSVKCRAVTRFARLNSLQITANDHADSKLMNYEERQARREISSISPIDEAERIFNAACSSVRAPATSATEDRGYLKKAAYQYRLALQDALHDVVFIEHEYANALQLEVDLRESVHAIRQRLREKMESLRIFETSLNNEVREAQHAH